mmetsp:Transcript_31955/g.92524  ORF Transcript_31955/g.92524 Transcript_31955/m.92524 type:complete len:240 (-) Transcript_31955:120-839(-)
MLQLRQTLVGHALLSLCSLEGLVCLGDLLVQLLEAIFLGGKLALQGLDPLEKWPLLFEISQLPFHLLDGLLAGLRLRRDIFESSLDALLQLFDLYFPLVLVLAERALTKDTLALVLGSLERLVVKFRGGDTQPGLLLRGCELFGCVLDLFLQACRRCSRRILTHQAELLLQLLTQLIHVLFHHSAPRIVLSVALLKLVEGTVLRCQVVSQVAHLLLHDLSCRMRVRFRAQQLNHGLPQV